MVTGMIVKKKVHTKKGELFFQKISFSSMLSAGIKKKSFSPSSPRKKRRVFFPRSRRLPRSIWRVWNGRFATFLLEKIELLEEETVGKDWAVSSRNAEALSSNLLGLVQLALLLSYQRLKIEIPNEEN